MGGLAPDLSRAGSDKFSQNIPATIPAVDRQFTFETLSESFYESFYRYIYIDDDVKEKNS